MWRKLLHKYGKSPPGKAFLPNFMVKLPPVRQAYRLPCLPKRWFLQRPHQALTNRPSVIRATCQTDYRDRTGTNRYPLSGTATALLPMLPLWRFHQSVHHHLHDDRDTGHYKDIVELKARRFADRIRNECRTFRDACHAFARLGKLPACLRVMKG